ncbi:hypothetical protein [Azospirillum soli]|uniref:hypothetical protein n=1 Tax=Azospirillum soli TaxID=1304799 RepID=UPI001AE7A2E0|nr:hypothetical protein [Azospirillum soli]MBP2316406.1 hypothetical protein [Azospirillum soli]
MKHRVIAVGALVASIGVFTTLDAHAQQRQNNPGQGQNQQQQPQQVTLPPALQAAVNSGNADQVSRAIATLSAGNPQQAATLATQVVTVAERMLNSNPQAAIQAAAAAVETIRSTTVQTSAPTQALEVVTTAARIIVNPDAQRVAPLAVAGMATAVVQVVSSPAVYQISPSTAIQVMANSYAAVTSQAVVTAAPGATQAVAQSITQASSTTVLNQVNPANSGQTLAILEGKVAPVAKLETGGNQSPNTPNTPNGPPTTTPNTDRPSNNPAQDRVPDTVTLPDKVFTNASPS